MGTGVYHMESWQIIIIALFGAAFGYHMYQAGIKQGAELCIEKLHEKKIISFDNAGNIKPNPFWEEVQKSKK